MPQVGERKTVNGVTGEFDGQTWHQVSDTGAAEPSQAPGLMRFLGGAASTSPLNPMNLARAVAHPLDTLVGAVKTPLTEGRQALSDFADTVTGNGENGRLLSFLNGVKHTGGAVPLIGKAAIDAGDKIGNGDLAGGAGELAGLASGALLPKVPGAVADSLEAVGKGAEALGTSKMLSRARNLSPITAATGHVVPAMVQAALPTVLEYGGKGIQGGVNAMRGLAEAAKTVPGRFGIEPEVPFVPKSTEVPGFSYTEPEPNAFTKKGPAAAPGSDEPFTHEGFVQDLRRSAGEVPNGGLTETPAFKGLQEAIRQSNLTPAQKFIESEPQIGVAEGGRTTGAASTPLADTVFGKGGGLDSLNDGPVDQHITPSTLDELSRLSGRALSPEDAQALLNKYRNFGEVQ